MKRLDECKSCSGNVRLSQEEITNILEETARSGKVRLASEETYLLRLETCRTCSALDYGTTCRFCGCIVQIKARLESSKCPFPYAPKW